MHQRIFIEPDLFWLDDSLERVQKLCKTETKQRQTREGLSAHLLPVVPRRPLSRTLHGESSLWGRRRESQAALGGKTGRKELLRLCGTFCQQQSPIPGIKEQLQSRHTKTLGVRAPKRTRRRRAEWGGSEWSKARAAAQLWEGNALDVEQR